MPPPTASQMTKRVPVTMCMTVAASNQTNCIARPRIADAGASCLSEPPARHYRQAATINARPATAKPTAPVNLRSQTVASW